MHRVHVVELEDYGWFPEWLRSSMTRLIAVFSRVIGVPSVLASLVARALGELETSAVVDLGSGSGGSMPEVVQRVREMPGLGGVELTMTDRYPSAAAVERFAALEASHLRYLSEPVDATELESTPPGLKTMINCFHHMRPAEARKILQSAREGRQPLLVYEMAENKLPFWIWCLALPLRLSLVALTALFLTPWVRPLTARQLVFTYLIPAIPLCYAWDGQASMPRIYSDRDLDELLEGLHGDGYRWEKGPAVGEGGRRLGNYVLGLPTRPS